MPVVHLTSPYRLSSEVHLTHPIYSAHHGVTDHALLTVPPRSRKDLGGDVSTRNSTHVDNVDEMMVSGVSTALISPVGRHFLPHR
jgi:hypothetical protein